MSVVLPTIKATQAVNSSDKNEIAHHPETAQAKKLKSPKPFNHNVS